MITVNEYIAGLKSINCEECGAKLDDDAVFCEECGTRIEMVQDNLISVAENPIKTKNSKKLFVIIAFVLMCVAVGVGFMIWTGKIGNSKPKPSENNVAGSDESTTEEKVVFNYNSYQSAPASRVAGIENIEANIVNRKAEFAFEYDSWGNAGHGYIEFFDDKISIKIEITYLEPSSMWDVGGGADFEISNNEDTAKDGKRYIDEYLKIIEDNGYVYMYTSSLGVQYFDCMIIMYTPGRNKIMISFPSAFFTKEYYYKISDKGMAELGQTTVGYDYEGNAHYYIGDNEVDRDIYIAKSEEWFMPEHITTTIENGKYSYDEIFDIVSLLKS